MQAGPRGSPSAAAADGHPRLVLGRAAIVAATFAVMVLAAMLLSRPGTGLHEVHLRTATLMRRAAGSPTVRSAAAGWETYDPGIAIDFSTSSRSRAARPAAGSTSGPAASDAYAWSVRRACQSRSDR